MPSGRGSRLPRFNSAAASRAEGGRGPRGGLGLTSPRWLMLTSVVSTVIVSEVTSARSCAGGGDEPAHHAEGFVEAKIARALPGG